MNSFLNKLERKYGRYAISNLSLYIIICYVIGYFLSFTSSISGTGILSVFALDPYKILHGQIWRIISWIIIPPSSFNLFTIIMLFFYYSLGTNLERTWGTFRYNVYILSGILFTLIGSFILYGVYVALDYPGVYAGSFIAGAFSTYYINLSIFLAFAASYPDMQIMLYFIIPVKIKWLAYLDVAVLALSFFQGNWAIKVVIIASLLNFIVFFFGTRNLKYVSPKEVHRRQEFKQQVKRNVTITKHKCAICGRTEKDNDTLEFRFCSKCNGNYEYCNDHLFTHEHIK